VIGIGSIFVVRDGLTTGQASTAAVIYSAGSKVYRSSSPVEYWIMMGIASIACVGGIVGSIFMSIGVVVDYIKKLARQKKNEPTSQP
jgi:hypothetical protein